LLKIEKKANEYRKFAAETLSDLVKIKSFSGEEEEVCRKIADICQDIGMDEVRIDKLGSVVARLGSGDKILAFDAHVDIDADWVVLSTGLRPQPDAIEFAKKVQADLQY
jgi:acetylornithine deacetylase/succinyl-diaminopimelate desuccinylase-like protein